MEDRFITCNLVDIHYKLKHPKMESGIDFVHKQYNWKPLNNPTYIFGHIL